MFWTKRKIISFLKLSAGVPHVICSHLRLYALHTFESYTHALSMYIRGTHHRRKFVRQSIFFSNQSLVCTLLLIWMVLEHTHTPHSLINPLETTMPHGSSTFWSICTRTVYLYLLIEQFFLFLKKVFKLHLKWFNADAVPKFNYVFLTSLEYYTERWKLTTHQNQ